MKKLLLLVLIVAVGAWAFVSKPSDPEKSFAKYLERNNGMSESDATAEAADCDYRDRFLWVDVKQKPDEKTVYTSAFHFWINRGELRRAVKHDVHKAENAIEHAKDKVTSAH